jgi:hypothetical protein
VVLLPATSDLSPVSEHQWRIADYQRQAKSCIDKAEQTRDETARRHYRQLAETYLQLVQMELRRIEIRGTFKTDGDA